MQFEVKSIDARWLMEANKQTLVGTLSEYDLIQRSFVPWLCHIMANTENERVRLLVLPNLIEECGNFRRKHSHQYLYRRMLKSNGISVANHKFSKLTIETGKRYTKLFSSKNTYRSLCAVGPGIEAISSDFLYPMYQGVLKHFGDAGHLIYFTLHLSEIENDHASSIEDAMRILEDENPKLLKKKEKYINEGVEIFKNFWDNLPKPIKP